MQTVPTRSSCPSAVHSANERESTRAVVEAEITFESEDNFYKGFSENISEGGLFVVTYQSHRSGDVITVRFTLPGLDRLIETKAEVRWSREGDRHRGLTPGFGVRFLALSDDDRCAIERFVRAREPLFFDE